MPILTHDRIKVASPANGVLRAATNVAWGNHAIQSITVGRHTPHDRQSALGYQGIVDYTSGIITSDVAIDAILTEGGTKATNNTSVNKYAGNSLTVGTENYVLTSSGVTFGAGTPATIHLGYITGTIASYLDIQSQPSNVSGGEESQFCVVMGDDGSGIIVVPTWYTVPTGVQQGTVSYIDSSGNIATFNDGGLPVGIQNINMQANINRDQILDVRVAGAVQFITTYPVDVTCDMEVYDLPVASGTGTAGKPGGGSYNATTFKHVFGSLQNLMIAAQNFGKHVSGGATTANNGDVYAKIIGLRLNDESEAVSVGRYLAYTMNFSASDLQIPV